MNLKITTARTDALADKAQEAARFKRPRAEAFAEAAHLEIRPIEEALDAALEKVNGRASSHTLSASGVVSAAQRAEMQMEASGLPKALRVGAVASFTPSGPGSAYARKGSTVVTTRITMRRVTDGWRLIKAEKVDIPAGRLERSSLDISEEARARILENAMKGYTVASKAKA